jgi:diamine N-acetyltransferase
MLALLHELAEYERLTRFFRMTQKTIARDFFGPRRAAFCDLAFDGKEPVGIATWYWIYSSFASMRGIFLEDLYVREQRRGEGFGLLLLAHLAKTAKAKRGSFVKWSVLDWNAPSIAFYKSLGAKAPTAWTDYQLAGDAFQRLARS